MARIHYLTLASLAVSRSFADVSAGNPMMSVYEVGSSFLTTVSSSTLSILRSDASLSLSLSSTFPTASGLIPATATNISGAEIDEQDDMKDPGMQQAGKSRKKKSHDHRPGILYNGNVTFVDRKDWFERKFYKELPAEHGPWELWSRSKDLCCFRLDVRQQTFMPFTKEGKFRGQLRLNDDGHFSLVKSLYAPDVSAFNEANRVCHQDGYLFTERGQYCGFDEERMFVCNLDSPSTEFKNITFTTGVKSPFAFMEVDGDPNWIMCKTQKRKHRHSEWVIYKLPFSNEAKIPGHCRVVWLDERKSCHEIRKGNLPQGFHLPGHELID